MKNGHMTPRVRQAMWVAAIVAGTLFVWYLVLTGRWF